MQVTDTPMIVLPLATAQAHTMSPYNCVNMSFAKQTCEYTHLTSYSCVTACYIHKSVQGSLSFYTPFSQFETTIQTIYINTNPLYYEQTLSAREYWVT